MSAPQQVPFAPPVTVARLRAVAERVVAGTHADIGSDHGRLLVDLLRGGQIARGIAIENKPRPLQNSRHALAGLNAEVRFGDGLAPLAPAEVDCVSICGLGGARIVKILRHGHQRVPPRLVLQPNRQPELVRAWALRNGYWLIDECLAGNAGQFVVLSFQQGRLPLADPAYDHLERQASLLFGPLLYKRGEPWWWAGLEREAGYLQRLPALDRPHRRRLRCLQRLLARQRGTV